MPKQADVWQHWSGPLPAPEEDRTKWLGFRIAAGVEGPLQTNQHVKKEWRLLYKCEQTNKQYQKVREVAQSVWQAAL